MIEANETVGTANQLVDFGEAVRALKEGKRVTREYWDYEPVFIFRQVPSSITSDIVPKMTSLPQTVKDELQRRFEGPEMTDGKIKYQNQLALVYSNNLIESWSPQSDDALAEDWIILD